MCRRIFDLTRDEETNTQGELVSRYLGDDVARIVWADADDNDVVSDLCLCWIDVVRTLTDAGYSVREDDCGDYEVIASPNAPMAAGAGG